MLAKVSRYTYLFCCYFVQFSYCKYIFMYYGEINIYIYIKELWPVNHINMKQATYEHFFLN